MTIALSFDLIPAALGVLGAVLVARYDRLSGYGWAFWILSNALWIFWAITGSPDGKVLTGILAQNCIFFVTSLQGFFRWRAQQKFNHKSPFAS